MQVVISVPDSKCITSWTSLTLPHQVASIMYQQLISFMTTYLPMKSSNTSYNLRAADQSQGHFNAVIDVSAITFQNLC